jgi:hypothetical protein
MPIVIAVHGSINHQIPPQPKGGSVPNVSWEHWHLKQNAIRVNTPNPSPPVRLPVK